MSELKGACIFGQSGGGAKVWTLMQMPEADGLFHKGIVQSGVIEALSDVEDRDGREIVLAMLRELGLAEKDVDKLKTIPYRQLAEAYLKVSPEIEAKGGYVGNFPHTGKAYLGDPVKYGFTEHAKTIPILIGTVLGEFDFKPAIPGNFKSTLSLLRANLPYNKENTSNIISTNAIVRNNDFSHKIPNSKRKIKNNIHKIFFIFIRFLSFFNVVLNINCHTV